MRFTRYSYSKPVQLLLRQTPYALWKVGALCLALGAGKVYAQPTLEADREVLVTFANGRVITRAEFEHAYLKRHGQPRNTQRLLRELREELRAYINVKRKVMEAEALGLDTTLNFRVEYETYLGQLRQSYLAETEVLDQLVDEAYERSQVDVRAAHLLLRLPPYPTPADTEQVYQRCLLLRDSLLRYGVPFHALARRHTQDASTAAVGGELGYFSVLEMVYPFETAAYRTPVGSVSLPIRTPYGYHLVQVLDRVPNRGGKRAAHILLPGPSLSDATAEADTAQARQLAYQVYQELKAGKPFQQLAAEYSQDPQTAGRGGDLGYGRLTPALEAQKARLSPGEFSAPFLTPHGWHILAVTEQRPMPQAAELRSLLKQRLRTDARFELAQSRFVETLKQTYKFKPTKGVAQRLAQALGSRYLRLGASDVSLLDPELLSTPLFAFADQNTSVFELLEGRVNSRQVLTGDVLSLIERDINLLAYQKLVAYEEEQLAIRYPEYRALVREYHDGILLFEQMEQRVWRPATEDTAAVRQYYETHLTDYTRPVTLRIVKIEAETLEVLQQLLDQLETGGSGQAPTSHPAALNLSAGTSHSVSYRVSTRLVSTQTPTELNEFLRHQPGWRTPIAETPTGGFAVDYYAEMLHPGGIVPFARCKAEVVRAYQSHLETRWVRALAREYPAEIDEKILRRLFKR